MSNVCRDSQKLRAAAILIALALCLLHFQFIRIAHISICHSLNVTPRDKKDKKKARADICTHMAQ